MNKAIFISDYDDDYRSPILSAIDDIGPMEELLFPFLNFTCSGNITRLIFVASMYMYMVARRAHQSLSPADSHQNNVTSFPLFSLWHQYRMDDDSTWMQRVGIIPPNDAQLVSVQPASTSVTGDSQEEVLMINITVSSIPFQPGYILGLRQYSMNTQPNQYKNIIIKVLRQTVGYGLTLSYTDWPRRVPAVNFAQRPEMPYIAIDTSM